MKNKKNAIPDRWTPYTPIGAVIPGTRFVACKVPLSESLLRNMPPETRFGPGDLLSAVPNVKLLIDLTNTDRYYDKQEFTRNRVRYEKLYCPGHVVPPNGKVKRFFDIVDSFLKAEQDPDSLIVVHCTHGVNRTGYFICRYMIEKLNIDPVNAIEGFGTARGHPIERPNYTKHLKGGSFGKGGGERKAHSKGLKEEFRKRCNVEETGMGSRQDWNRPNRRYNDSYVSERRGPNVSSNPGQAEGSWRKNNRNNGLPPRDNHFPTSQPRPSQRGGYGAKINIFQPQWKNDKHENVTDQYNDLQTARGDRHDGRVKDGDCNSSRYSTHDYPVQQPPSGRYFTATNASYWRPNDPRFTLIRGQTNVDYPSTSTAPMDQRPAAPRSDYAPLPTTRDRKAQFSGPHDSSDPAPLDREYSTQQPQRTRGQRRRGRNWRGRNSRPGSAAGPRENQQPGVSSGGS